MRFFFIAIFGLIFCIGCIKSEKEIGFGSENKYEITEAFPHLSFIRPVDLQHSGDGTNRLFVVEQRGVISVFENNPSTMDLTVFLDITDRVSDGSSEGGLLGLAFHPEYENNGYFFVNYTSADPVDPSNRGRTVISRFQVSPDDPDRALHESEEVVLTFDQPYWNHNGGQLSFGPDEYLYIAVGDGGRPGDPHGHGQNRTTLLGSILRIDVDNQQGGRNYAIPADNPFAGNNNGYRDEIFAYGLRNPWRFSFDTETGWLWAGDVGQNAYEEINIIKSGRNYGWNIMEGNHCYQPPTDCDRTGLELPIRDYSHERFDKSVTGGFVYRGTSLPELKGTYIYADYISGRIWSLDFSDLDNPTNTLLARVNFGISSFGVDQDNELYICGFDRKIHRIQKADPA